MKQYFYSHLIEIETINEQLDKMNLSDEEKLHLATLLDSSLHHTILDAIFSELSDEDKKVFIQHLSSEDQEKIWRFLGEKVDGVEDKIKKAAEDIKKEIHKDIREASLLQKQKIKKAKEVKK